MITSSSNEIGAHLLFNEKCDVIGKRVFDIIAESVDLKISYFCHFPKKIRPIHCAILMRNERIVKCLIEENLKFNEIKNNDLLSEKALRTAILRMVRSNPFISIFSRQFILNTQQFPRKVQMEKYDIQNIPKTRRSFRLFLALKLFLDFSHLLH